jgi:hypothetical protein
VVNLWQTEGINTVDIIERKKSKRRKIAIVVSARGKQLMSWTIFLLLQPKRKLQTALESFKTYQKEVLMLDFSTEFDKLDKLFEVSLIGDYSVKIQEF